MPNENWLKFGAEQPDCWNQTFKVIIKRFSQKFYDKLKFYQTKKKTLQCNYSLEIKESSNELQAQNAQ